MRAVRLTNDWVSAAVESVESLHLPMSVIFADGLEDLALITRYNGIHSSPDPFVILETGNKHTCSRHTCIQTRTRADARTRSRSAVFISFDTLLRPQLSQRLRGSSSASQQTHKALSYTFFIMLND